MHTWKSLVSVHRTPPERPHWIISRCADQWHVSTLRVPGAQADPDNEHLKIEEDGRTSGRLRAVAWIEPKNRGQQALNTTELALRQHVGRLKVRGEAGGFQALRNLLQSGQVTQHTAPAQVVEKALKVLRLGAHLLVSRAQLSEIEQQLSLTASFKLIREAAGAPQGRPLSDTGGTGSTGGTGGTGADSTLDGLPAQTARTSGGLEC